MDTHKTTLTTDIEQPTVENGKDVIAFWLACLLKHPVYLFRLAEIGPDLRSKQANVYL